MRYTEILTHNIHSMFYDELYEGESFAHVGEKAPEFTMEGVEPKSHAFKPYALSDSRGKWTVLFFYPLDFTFICPTEITQFDKRFEDFQKLDAVVYGCSTDSVHAHKKWLADLGELAFPLLSDITHEVSSLYRCLVPKKGIALRATFIIDPDGTLRYASYNDLDTGRSVDEVLRTLSALQTGERCPVEWKPGEKTLGRG